MPAKSASSSLRVVIVGASSLLGKELKAVLEDRNFPSSDIILLDESPAVGILTEAAGEATFIRPLEEDSFELARFVFFAGRPAETQQYWRAAQQAGSTVIDLTGGLMEVPGSVVRIVALKKILPPPANGGFGGALYRTPATASIIACTLASVLRAFTPARLAMIFYWPASERDQAGVDELESQTTNLLSFRPIDQAVFDARVAFNLLSSFGNASAVKLRDIRARLSRETAGYLAGRVVSPAIQLVQAPVFYGTAFSAYVELAAAHEPAELEDALIAAGIKLSAGGETGPGNVDVAGENEIHIARIEREPTVAGGYWLWGAADNLRLAAVNAVQIAEELLAS